MVCEQARAKAAFALRKLDLKIGMPIADACPPRYNASTDWVDWESQTVRMPTTGGPQMIRFD